jgi:hypothetical protein
MRAFPQSPLRVSLIIAAVSALAAVLLPMIGRTEPTRYDTEYPTIGYGGKAQHNEIERLQDRLDRGEVKLEFRGQRGYLDSLLKLLDIDPSSQVLVYSKTSLQVDHISAATPRAIYFNDDTYVAWVQNSQSLELAAMDDNLGPVFYTLHNVQGGNVAFDRQSSRCLTCHDRFAMSGGGVPQFLLDSAVVDTDGIVIGDTAPVETDDKTPLDQRWGGWYVTGIPDGLKHLGNMQIRRGAARAHASGGTLRNLDGLLDTTPYVRGSSDVVALLVLEHQLLVKNLITRLNYKARTWLADSSKSAARSEEQAYAAASPQIQKRIGGMVEQLVQTMLFTDAVTYPNPLLGTSGYDKWFASQGPRDAKGRSLREFDLHTRLFKYPLSYVIYSDAFNALPSYVKSQVYQRLHEILSGEDHSAVYSRLTVDQRKSILDILTATKSDFASATRVAGSTPTRLAQSTPPSG